MVLPLFKVLSLVIRVFSKPLINFTKQVHLRKEVKARHPLLRKGFISLGNTYNKCQGWINRKFMKIQSQFAYKPLNDELALEKGIEFFYQIVFYSIIIGLPLYQMIYFAKQAIAKSTALQNKLKKIEDQLEDLKKGKNQQNLKREGKYEGKKQIENENQKILKNNSQTDKEQKETLTKIKKIRFVYSNNQVFTINLNNENKQYSIQLIPRIQKQEKTESDKIYQK